MALASLVNMPTAGPNAQAFAFEHAMAHRNFLGALAPLDRFSVLPYLIDPQQQTGKWRLNHQQSHNDAIVNLPTWFGFETVGINSGQNLLDLPPNNPAQLSWWTHANHQDHLVAMAVLPLAEEWTWPFW